MPKITVTILFFICISINVISQNIDSLINNLDNFRDDDTMKVEEIIKIVSKLKRRDNEKAMIYLVKGYELSDKLSYLKGRTDLLIREGDILVDKANYKEATEKLNQALQLARKIKNDDLIASTLDYLGTISFYKGNYDESLRLLEQSMELRKKIGDSSLFVHDYIKIGNVYAAQENYGKALEYFFYIDDNETDESKKVELYYNIGLVYHFKGEINNSVRYFLESMKLSKKYGPNDIYFLSITSLGQNYEALGMYEKALEYHFRSLKQFKKQGDNLGLLTAKMNIGKCYLEIGKYKESIRHLTNTLEIAETTEHFNKQALSAEMLSEAYEKINDYKNAFLFHKKSRAISDSISTDNANKQLMELQTKYDTEKKEARIQYLGQQNTIKEEQLRAFRYRVILIITISVFILFVLVIMYWYNRLKSKQKTAKVEQKLLRLQMNPHFIFNSLTAIQSFVLEKQSSIASRYLSNFSRLIRWILESSAKEYISLEQEVNTIQHYLDLHKMINSDVQFSYDIELSPDIEPISVYIPPMLTQPFIENAIKHGLVGIKEGGLIIIRFSIDDKNKIKIEVEDNGIGIEKSIELKRNLKNTHKSMAMDITKERLLMLNNWGKKKMKLNVVDLKHYKKQGTKVSFIVPFKYD